MEKIRLAFTIEINNIVKEFIGCEVNRQTIKSICSVTLFAQENHIKETIENYLDTFCMNNKCTICGYSFSKVSYPIYSPKTIFDETINKEWDEILNNENTLLILDAFYSKYEKECFQCGIKPSNPHELDKYAEQMLNQIMDNEDKKIFYKFISHKH